MKFLIILLMAFATAHAMFPKLVLKYDSEEDGPLEKTLVKLPLLDLFGKPTLFDKLSDKKEKPKLFDKIADKIDDKLDDKILSFFDDPKNTKIVLEKLHPVEPLYAPPPPPPLYAPPPPPPTKYVPPPPPPPPPAACKCVPVVDDCDDGYRYFS